MHAVVVAAPAPTAAATELLVERALAWAQGVTGSPAARVAPGSPAEIAAARDHPLLLVASHMPRFGEVHAHGLRDDLAAGADLVLGATLGGSWYLLALAAPQPALLAGWAPPYGAAEILGAAGAAGLEVGLLRHERALESAADTRALLADPLLAPEVREALDV